MKRTLGALLLLVLALGLFCASAGAEMAAQSLLSEGRVDVAIADLRQHLRAQPNDAQAYHLLCRAHYSLQQWDKAIAAAQTAVAEAILALPGVELTP